MNMTIIEAVKKIFTNGTPEFHANSAFIRKALTIYNRNCKDPGDCEGDDSLLLGLSIAEAHIGVRPGWIPEVQKIGVRYAEILEKA